MSNAFTNWLTNARSIDPKSGGVPILKDYQHASRLYVDDFYSLSPKVGFLYFVSFNLNRDALSENDTWANRDSQDFGLLVKKIDLPKFKIHTDTLNQYNRKTVVQTKLTYDPVTIEFHDDNADIVNSFWVHYYKHYYYDSNYGGASTSGAVRDQSVPEFNDTKYKQSDYLYGRYNSARTQGPFITSIDIYVLHQQQFTQITLVNPKITDWAHDTLSQSEGAKILQNRMSVAYENVFYNQGQIQAGTNPEGFAAVYYDKTPSPLQIAGNSQNAPQYSRQKSEFDQPGKARVFGVVGGNYKTRNPITDIASILIRNQINKTGLGRVKPGGYNIASGILGALGNSGSGKYSDPPPTQNQPGIINLPGGVGINIFKGLNTSVDGKIRANPAAIIFPKTGGSGP
jgi:hypothetical protein